MKASILKGIFIVAAVISVLSGCIKSVEPTPPDLKTYISILHLAPTAPSFDIFFNEEKVSNTPFDPGVVTSYNVVDKGTFAIKFKKLPLDSLVAQVPSSLYDSLSYYTIFVYNVQPNGPANALKIKDDFSDVLANTTKPYYRFFHASPNTGAVDLYIDDIKIENGRTPADNATNGLLNKFLAITSGLRSLKVKLAGTDTVIATLPNYEFSAGNAYTIYLKGLDGGTGTKELSIGVLRAS